MPNYEVTYLTKVTVQADNPEAAADRVQDVLEQNEGGAVFSVVEVNKPACGSKCGCSK